MVLNADSVLNFMPSGLQEFGKKAQVGVDLSIKNITRISGGKLYQDNRKEIDPYTEVDFYKENNIKTWILDPGVYSLTFDQDIKLDSKHCAFIVGRSTTNRLGLLLRSAVFDPGFECSEIGATLYVFNKGIEIQEHSRLAQLVIFESEDAETYQGSYQGDNDLK